MGDFSYVWTMLDHPQPAMPAAPDSGGLPAEG